MVIAHYNVIKQAWVFLIFFPFIFYAAEPLLIEIVPKKVNYNLADNGIYYTLDISHDSKKTFKVSPDYCWNAIAVNDFKDMREKISKHIMNIYTPTNLTLYEAILIANGSDEYFNKQFILNSPSRQILYSNPETNAKEYYTLPNPQEILKLLTNYKDRVSNNLNIRDREKSDEFYSSLTDVDKHLKQLINLHDKIKTIKKLTIENDHSFYGTLDLTQFTKQSTPELTELTILFYIQNIHISNDSSIKKVIFMPKQTTSQKEYLGIITKEGNTATIRPVRPYRTIQLQKSNSFYWSVFITGASLLGIGAGVYLYYHPKTLSFLKSYIPFKNPVSLVKKINS